MHRIFYAQNTTTEIPETNYFLAGTSPDSKILKSIDDGLNWTDEGTLGKGNPTCFNYINSSNIWYGTTTGYICNYIDETFIKVSNYQINSIYTDISNDIALLGDSNGDFYYTPISDFYGWSLQYGLGYSINYIRYDSTLGTLLFTSNGIYSYSWPTLTLRQSGNFTCAVYDSVNGFVYAGTSTGHVYRNTTTNVFTVWTDLGDKTLGNSIFSISLLNSNRIAIIDIEGLFYYTDDYFSTLDSLDPFGGVNGSLCISNSTVLFGGILSDGHIWRSSNNGVSWTDLGQQYSQTSINCLTYV